MARGRGEGSVDEALTRDKGRPGVRQPDPAGSMARMTSTPALLMIAHGTRNPDVAAEVERLIGLVRQRLGVPVGMAWVEWDLIEPAPVDAVGSLLGQGADSLVTLPLLAFAAGHAKTDVPEELARIDDAYPGLARRHGTVVGLHPGLLELARRRVADARAAAGLALDVPDDEALLVTGPGSSDPDANGDLAKAGRFLAETTGHRWAEIAFAGVSWPKADEALRRMRAAGARRVTRFSWSLLAGVLERRVDQMAAGVTDETGLAVVDAGRFGPDGALADAVADRYHEALHGDARANCDLCQFRLPLPGRENRAGLPSAGGTGAQVHPEAQRIQAARADANQPVDWKKA